MVFSVLFFKKQFSNIRDLESGLNNFWNHVLIQYGGYWNFQVIQDQI